MKIKFVKKYSAALLCMGSIALLPRAARAVSSAEVYTGQGYQYGRFEARIQFAPGDGVVSSFFLWKDGSEMESVFWNELDFEKLRAGCELETNALFGLPESSHNLSHTGVGDLCGTFRTYAYEWTPDYIAWFIDGVEIRRETGEVAVAYRDNATEGMQIRFNVWPGDESFGGTFDPAILPVYQYINWVQYSSYVNGGFQLEWREDFNDATLPARWSKANWSSPKGLSTHAAANVTLVDGCAVLSLTADDAPGGPLTSPDDPEESVVTPPVVQMPEIMPSATSPVASAPPTDPMAGANADESGTPEEGCGCRTVGSRAGGSHAGGSYWSALGLGIACLVRRRKRHSVT